MVPAKNAIIIKDGKWELTFTTRDRMIISTLDLEGKIVEVGVDQMLVMETVS